MTGEDTRELVLARLLALALGLRAAPPPGVPTLKLVVRNQLGIGEADSPAFSLLDGDEDDNDDDPPYRPGRAARRMVMRPQGVFLVQASRDDAGTQLNALRAAWLAVVRGDAELAAILGPNGFVRYRGAQTTYLVGRACDGTMLVNIAFGYMV